ncbi:hypothetical protein FQN54_008026 [Arachnomyces sp. PD_36]|nr:hypothetical protein FQN54_008026 [Arachnomyces sp. PD_36]
MAVRSFPRSGFQQIDPSSEIEEETLPTYRREKYYPVKIGEVFDNRYQVVGKLGYGVTSTVWLGRDLLNGGPEYVTLKVYVSGLERDDELNAYQRINSIETDHPGQNFIRKLLGHFWIDGPRGRHICLVHQPLGRNLDQILHLLPGRAIKIQDLKPFLRQVLLGVDFLHTAAQIIHTDLQLKNLLLPTPETHTFSAFEKMEVEHPSPRKVLEDGGIIHTTQQLPVSNGLPLICDFGEARFGDEEQSEDIMPNVYRAPEVVLKLNWDYKVDIWSVAMLAWDLVSGDTLFQGKNSENIFDDRVHVSELIALLGPPPTDFVQRSRVSSAFWDEHGHWKGLAPIPNTTLEKRAVGIQEASEVDGFLRFIRKALKWDPEERPTARELLFDAWLMKGLDTSNFRQSTIDQIIQ